MRRDLFPRWMVLLLRLRCVMSGGHEPAVNFYACAYCGMGADEIRRRGE
jgi:hypothetical protein